MLELCMAIRMVSECICVCAVSVYVYIHTYMRESSSILDLCGCDFVLFVLL